MIEKLRQLFESPGSDNTQTSDHDIHLAALTLCVELARADGERQLPEVETIVTIATETFDLSVEEAGDLLKQAELEANSATDLFDFTDLINRKLDKPDKHKLIESLWRVAYADGTLDRYEDHLIRKIADLIYVSHSDFIRIKHAVSAASD